MRLHDLRHTFASHAVLQGVPLPVVSRLLGHKQPSMTLRYAHVGDRETEAAAERIRRCHRAGDEELDERSRFRCLAQLVSQFAAVPREARCREVDVRR